MMRFVSPIVSGWKKINVEQRDKSHVGLQRKKKRIIIDLIKMVKKMWVHKEAKRMKEDKNFVLLLHKLFFEADETFLIHYTSFFLTMHNKYPLATK